MQSRLILFETRMLGDTVLSFPFICAASDQYEIFICCQPESAVIAAHVLDEAHILAWRPPWMAKRNSSRRWFDKEDRRFLKQLRHIQPDIAVSAWADVRLHLWMLLSGAPRRVGFPMHASNFYGSHLDWRKRQLFLGRLVTVLLQTIMMRPLLTQKIYRNSSSQSHLSNWRQLAESLGIASAWSATPPWFTVNSTNFDVKLRSFVNAAGQAHQKIWLLHPGGRNPVRRWPSSNFTAVVNDVFVRQNIPILIIHPPDTDFPVIKGNSVFNYTPDTIDDLIQTINAVDHVICNDSVASHLAAALGKSAVVIMGPITPDWFAPYGNQHRIVHNSGGCLYHPCLDTCRMPSVICMEAIKVEEVVRAVNEIISNDRRQAGIGIKKTQSCQQ